MLSGAKPSSMSPSCTLFRWFPWSSTYPPLAVPPQASLFLSFLATSFISISLVSIPSITVYCLPNFFFTILTNIRWLSLGICSHTHSSFGNPHTLHISAMFFLVTPIFFNLWLCLERIQTFMEILHPQCLKSCKALLYLPYLLCALGRCACSNLGI